MDMYQHDGAAMFRFVLRGELTGDRVGELKSAWITAQSILEGKELVVDLSGVANADLSAVDLLSRMREAGARLTAALPAESEELLRSLGVPVAAPRGRHSDARVRRLLRAARP
jgi:ABC-type transporter Mla MlaB component